MKRPTLGLVHTSATLVPIFQQLCAEKLPGVDTFNISDDSLIKDVIRKGTLTPETARRVVEHVCSAAEAGADMILVTCSSHRSCGRGGGQPDVGPRSARGPTDG